MEAAYRDAAIRVLEVGPRQPYLLLSVALRREEEREWLEEFEDQILDELNIKALAAIFFRNKHP